MSYVAMNPQNSKYGQATPQTSATSQVSNQTSQQVSSNGGQQIAERIDGQTMN